MLEAYTKLALNFYFFLLGDEPLAITAANQTIQKIKKSKEQNLPVSAFLKIMLADYTKIKKKIKNKKIIGHHQLERSQWSLISAAKMAKWKSFLRTGDSQQEIVLALRYLLNISTEDIAVALEVPKGTVLYRLGRGLELLSVK